MKIVIAPDSFKGSASSIDIANWIENGILSVIPNCETIKIAIGDGGEGTLDAAILAGFTPHEMKVQGPTNKTVQAKFGMRGTTTLIEMAQASGLAQLPEKKLEPLTATSFGTGELIRAALDKGATKIILAVGGSACTDAGAGALQALGAQIRDAEGHEIPLGGAALGQCREIDVSKLDKRLMNVEFILASDVANPLLGESGAAQVYAPQKGATKEDVQVLEDALAHFAQLAGTSQVNSPGAGAAGGLGFMALTFLNAKTQSGISLMIELVGLEQQLIGADLVITGEGKFDSQSLNGKAPLGIFNITAQKSIPVALICGHSSLNSSDEIVKNFQSIYSLTDIESDIEKCIKNPRPIIEKIAASIAKKLIN